MKKQLFFPKLTQCQSDSKNFTKIDQVKTNFQDGHDSSHLRHEHTSNNCQFFIKFIPTKHSPTIQHQNNDIMRINKNYNISLTLQRIKGINSPPHKRCVNKIIQITSPQTERYNKMPEDSSEHCKLHDMKIKVNYKFKKSMIEVRRRKQQRNEYLTNRSQKAREEAMVKLQAIVDRSINLKKSQSSQSKSIVIDDETRIHLPKMSTPQAQISHPNLSILSKIYHQKPRIKTSSIEQQSFLVNHHQLNKNKDHAYHLEKSVLQKSNFQQASSKNTGGQTHDILNFKYLQSDRQFKKRKCQKLII